MHKKLKFSFGHILAFLALIYIGYVTFVSITYLLYGNYLVSGLVVIGVVVVLLYFFLKLQLLKSVNQQFEKYVKRERIVFVILIIMCVLVFVPYSHFWTVKQHEDVIVSSFERAFNTSSQMFDEYDEYSKARLDTLESILNDNKDEYPISSLAMHKGLTLQLRPDEFVKLEEEVNDWINTSMKSCSIWNVFLIGNIDNIRKNMCLWSEVITKQSKGNLSCEPVELIEPFDYSETVEEVCESLDGMHLYYTNYRLPTFMAWLTGFFAFLMLFMPWIIQKRSPKSLVTLFGKKKMKGHEGAELKEGNNKIKANRRAGELDEHTSVQKAHKAQSLEHDTTPEKAHRKAMSLDI